MHTAKADPSLLQSATKTEVGDRFNRTLFAALDALEEASVDFALIGGVASSGLGRPRSTHDIDLFVRPEDAGAALEALGHHGFYTEKTDLNWLFKGFKEDILVDVIFKSRGDIYFDTEMAEHSKPIEYHGRRVRTVAPEDLIIIKCAVHDELGPHHWHDALALLSHAQIDWEYLIKRARRAPRRLLALLLYAQSNDIWVPNKAIFELFKVVYSDTNTNMQTQLQPLAFTSILGGRALDKSMAANAQASAAVAKAAPSSAQAPQTPTSQTPPQVQRRTSDQYLVARIRDALAQDLRAGDQDIKVYIEGSRILLRGDVVSDEHRRAVAEVVGEHAQGFQIDNQLKVAVLGAPEGAEDVG